MEPTKVIQLPTAAPEQANSNFFDLYFSYVSDTESPTIYHRWCCISIIATALGRRFFFPFGSGTITPNMYVMLIGSPGARKSTAIKTGKKLLQATGFKNFAADKTTKEKFLLDLEGIEGMGDDNDADSFLTEIGNNRGKRRSSRAANKSSSGGNEAINNLFGPTEDDDTLLLMQEPREMYITADEFNEFVGHSNLEFLSMLGNLWDYSGVYRQRLKHGRSVAIANPTINILSGNTHAGFAEAFPPQAIGQGFLSRLILVYGETTGRKIPFPRIPSDADTARLVSLLGRIQTSVTGPAQLTSEAKHALEMIYRTWVDLEDMRFKHYSTRRYTHLLKLCLVCAAARLSTKLDVQDVLLANSILTFAESGMPKALGEFGKSRNSEAAGKIMSMLYEATRPLTIAELWKAVSTDLDKISALGELLMALQQAEKVQSVKGGFLAKQKPIDSKKLYVDYKLLLEWKGRASENKTV